MDHAAIDVHTSESQIEIRAEEGEVIEMRIRTDRRRFSEVFGGRRRMKILIESSTESEWVAQCLEKLGHEVVVADPNYTLMYGTRSRKIKTDRRDVEALADACESGVYRAAHRTSERMRHVRARLAVRESLVRTRSKFISLARALMRRRGYRIESGSVETFITRAEKLPLPGELKSELAPLLAVMLKLHQQIETSDQLIESLVEGDPVVEQLTTAPFIGAVTGAAYAASVDNPKRFNSAHQVEAYHGIVPSEMSSGEKQHRGPITKTGDKRVRWLLVQAAQSLLRSKPTSQTAVLHRWATAIASRRGKGIAVVALARRLDGILFAMMRDGRDFEPARVGAKLAQRKAA
jgi:transposase